jgi:alpha-N-arabinofuranosidase
VPLWCLGNEMDGPWQIGHIDARTYGVRAAGTAKAMKLVDPDIELVVCGSSGRDMPTFGEWETTVLDATWDHVDYLSLHAYYEQFDGDRRSFLASGKAMAGFIDDVASIVDRVGAARGSDKRLRLSFDEWNVWYITQFADPGRLEIAEAVPRLEQVYTALDAVVVGDLLVTLLNHADRVAIGCLAQLVNVIAPIRTEPGGPARRQPTFHPVAATFTTARGSSLVVEVTGPTVATRRHGDVPQVSAAATHDAGGPVQVFVVNRGESPVRASVRHPAPAGLRPRGAITLAAAAGPDAGARALPVRADEPGLTTLDLAPESWTRLTLS